MIHHCRCICCVSVHLACLNTLTPLQVKDVTSRYSRCLHTISICLHRLTEVCCACIMCRLRRYDDRLGMGCGSPRVGAATTMLFPHAVEVTTRPSLLAAATSSCCLGDVAARMSFRSGHASSRTHHLASFEICRHLRQINNVLAIQECTTPAGRFPPHELACNTTASARRAPSNGTIHR